MKRHIIMSRAPALSGKARRFGRGYRKLALVEIDPSKLPEGAAEPAMISPRARGMVRIIACRSVYYGKGVRSEGRAWLDRLRAEADRLNSPE